jgi:hypothetical protein
LHGRSIWHVLFSAGADDAAALFSSTEKKGGIHMIGAFVSRIRGSFETHDMVFMCMPSLRRMSRSISLA